MRFPDANGGTVSSPRDPHAAPFLAGIYPPAALPGWDIRFHEMLDSTNLEAKRSIARGETENRLILAEHQTNGQCRHDRLWESSPGKGIWASFILPVTVPAQTLPQATLVLAVAVREGVYAATGVSLNIKWPNDLLGNGKKCCGLLVETALFSTDAARQEPVRLVLGAGINCGHTDADFPPYLRNAATSLTLLAKGAPPDRGAVIAAVAEQVTRWFGIWETEGFGPVRAAWMAHNCTEGRMIDLPDGYGHTRAVARGIDETGALMAVAEDGTALSIHSGEIIFSGRDSASGNPAQPYAENALFGASSGG